VTLVHNSGGMREFIPQEYRWESYEDLKAKIGTAIESSNTWELKRPQLWSKIETLTPWNFQENIWSIIQSLMQQS
jgi:hypothetical protein